MAYATAGLPPAAEHPAIREDLAVAGTLLHALLVAGVAVVLTGLGPIVGATATLLAIDIGLAALIGDEWRLLPAALILGLLVDLTIRRLRPDRRSRAAAALTAAAFVAVLVLTLGVAGSLSWSVTLAVGAILLAGGAGWAIGALSGLRGSGPADVAATVDRA